MTAHRLTVRARLTALYGGVFLLAGVILLAITYVLLAQALNNDSFSREAVLAVPAGTAGVAGPITETSPVTETYPAVELQRFQLADELRVEFRRQTLTSLVQRGAVALAGVTLVGIWVGWLIAGRTLRPLQQITATARRVAGRNLHERIGLTGPRDELRQLADTFDDMLARLDESFGAQRRFVANASHELRTPLTINRTLIEVALSHPDPPPELRRLGETLLAVNTRHERLLEGLLVLAVSDRELTTHQPVDLAALSERLVDVARPEAAAAGVGLRTELRPAPVHGDPELLERLVQNLLRNAIAYNIGGGEVRVKCAGTRLTVANTGPVVLAHEIPGLFEPFRRLTDRVGSAEGSGLGLSIVRSIVTAHGGTVAAEPRPGGGLTVTVDLPPA
ncbi:two-component sensor histidine kinase [Actinoplanes italicus]|uniref:histidine kinase n=1 Tax=Actinoplanes italicus TaxID=113567 RepID=A0A2T0JWH0_9ACTN|nr:ATP-binding protein [Actinoplanes italicus]PRX12059.1 signal transduction histidine kinase [Actinoplanes italicus]GIE30870.1 two-component sensor histidine kinase [Actinoplanes italicus]